MCQCVSIPEILENYVVYSRSVVVEVNSEDLHLWNVKLLHVCGLSRECLLLVYIRVSWQESVAVFIDLHLLLESTIPKGERVKSTSKTIICNIHDSSIGKVRNSSPLHLHYGRRLLKSLASQSALSTERKLDGSFFTYPNRKKHYEAFCRE